MSQAALSERLRQATQLDCGIVGGAKEISQAFVKDSLLATFNHPSRVVNGLYAPSGSPTRLPHESGPIKQNSDGHFPALLEAAPNKTGLSAKSDSSQ